MAPSGVRVVSGLLLVLGVVVGGCAGVVLVDNGYEGVVVALEETLPPTVCQDVITGLEVRRRGGESVCC